MRQVETSYSSQAVQTETSSFQSRRVQTENPTLKHGFAQTDSYLSDLENQIE
jgi:hypothetical protein